MSFEALRSYVENTFAAFVQTSSVVPASSVHYPNAPFTQPPTTFLAVNIIEGKSWQADLGPRTVDRAVGVVQIDVMVPANTGTSAANTLATRCGNVFRRVNTALGDTSYVRFRIPEYMGIGTNQGFYRVCVRIPYLRDDPPQ